LAKTPKAGRLEDRLVAGNSHGAPQAARAALAEDPGQALSEVGAGWVHAGDQGLLSLRNGAGKQKTTGGNPDPPVPMNVNSQLAAYPCTTQHPEQTTFLIGLGAALSQ
jgi:hypothetical protein